MTAEFDAARLTTREFVVSISAERDVDVMALADALLDFLMAGGDEPLSEIVFSIDGVDPAHVDTAHEREWGYIRGYLHGWSDKVAGRQYGEGRNLRKPEGADGN